MGEQTCLGLLFSSAPIGHALKKPAEIHEFDVIRRGTNLWPLPRLEFLRHAAIIPSQGVVRKTLVLRRLGLAVSSRRAD